MPPSVTTNPTHPSSVSLRDHLDTLRYASSETQRTRAISFAWNFVRTCIASGSDNAENEQYQGTNLQAVEDVVSTLVAALGPGSDALRRTVLEILCWSVTQSPLPCQMRQFLYDLLPTLVMASEDDHDAHQAILDTVRMLSGKVNTVSMIPVVHCLSNVATDASRLSLLQLLYDALPTVSDVHLPDFIKEMIRLVAVQDAIGVWTVLRDEPRLGLRQSGPAANSCFTTSARIIALSLQTREYSEQLALSYFDLLTSLRSPCDREDSGHRQTQRDPLPLDLVVLLALYRQPQHVDRVDTIFDHWLSSQSSCLFGVLDALIEALRLEQSPFGLRQACFPGLLRVSIRFLLAPVLVNNVVLTDGIKSSSRQFILRLHSLLDRDQQDELTGCLMELSELSRSTTGSDGVDIVRSERHLRGEETPHLPVDVNEVPQSAMMVLCRLAETSPQSLIRFKHKLFHQINDETTNATPTATRELCLLLISLVQGESTSPEDAWLDPAELYTLMHKLLFSGAIIVRVSRGIILATELLLCDRFENKESIQTWVFGLLLPSTRRMIDPELGSVGLSFLKAVRILKSSPGSTVFTHFKMILANTGLIQMVASYQAAKRDNDASIVGYTDRTETLQVPIPSKTRAMIFCVNYFLRFTVDMVKNPPRWRFATQWVYELVDTYLQMGRQKAAAWRPEGWLIASIEFPTLFPTKIMSDTLSGEALDWMMDHFCCFDVNVTKGSMSAPHQYTKQIEKWTKGRVGHDAISRVSLSILIGISLSAAVLKNACEHLRMQESTDDNLDGSGDLLRLIKFQISKIFDLCAKSETLEALSISVRSKPNKVAARKAPVATTDKSGVRTSEKEAFDIVTRPHSALSASMKLRTAMLDNRDTFDTHVLWRILTDQTDMQTIRLCVNEMFNTSTQMASNSIVSCFRLIAFQANILRLLNNLDVSKVESSSSLKHNLLHCCRVTSFFIHAIPKLRKGLFSRQNVNGDRRGSESFVNVNAVVRLLKWYLRTIASYLLALQKEGSLDMYAKWFGNESQKWSMSNATPESRMFDYFESLLSSATNSVVANHLMEILSIITIRGNRSHMEQLVERSWSVLYTIYIDTGIDDENYEFIPWILVEFERQLERETMSHDEVSLSRLVNRTVTKLCFSSDHLRHGMMRHWGILMMANSATRREQHFSSMITELETFLRSLHREDSSEAEEDNPRKLKRHDVPSLMGLEAATFPTYFEALFQIIIASSASLRPGGHVSSPYQAIHENFVMFRKLIELYEKHFIVFPRAYSSIVSNASKDALTVALVQVDRCVVWRNRQPMLTIEEKCIGKIDPGSLHFLHHFIDQVAWNTVEVIVGLCNFWRSLKSTHTKPPRATTLRYAAEGAGVHIKAVLKAHSLVSMTSGAFLTSVEIGKHQQIKGKITTEIRLPEKNIIDCQSTVSDTDATDVEQQLPDLDLNDSDNSFAAHGNWGSNSGYELSLQFEGVSPCS